VPVPCIDVAVTSLWLTRRIGKEKARGVSDFAGFVVSLIQYQTSFLRDSKMQASVMTAAAQR
jgi:hypothetical protein